MSKKPLVVGNWKMYKTIDEARDFCETLAPRLEGCQADVYIAVPFTAIAPTTQRVAELKAPMSVGAQNMNDSSEGAFTGEVAGKMLKQAGASFVILGHSERRHIFGEDDAFVCRKVKRAFKDRLQPIVCVGETLEQREAGQTHEVIERQLLASLKGVEDLKNAAIAYEPVWAIGTGKVATPEEANEVHGLLRKLLKEHFNADPHILYGGSVKPDNAAELLAQSEIDGLLVGGASLSPEIFDQILGVCK